MQTSIQEGPWRLRQASIVLLAGTPIEPTSIDPQSMRDKEVIPQDWVISEEALLPIFAQIVFTNGARIRTEGNRCIFEQTDIGKDDRDFKAFHAAQKYADATELAVQYQAVGINWRLSPTSTQGGHHLLGAFLNHNRPLADFQPASIKLVTQLEGKSCNLEFASNGDSISVNVNYHHSLPHHRPSQVIANWRECWRHAENEILATVLQGRDQ